VFTREQTGQIWNSVYSIPPAQRQQYFARILELLGEDVTFTNFQLMQAIAQAQRELRHGKPLVSAA
jgi:hypothetical protein